jgi:hypothetical protein
MLAVLRPTEFPNPPAIRTLLRPGTRALRPLLSGVDALENGHSHLKNFPKLILARTHELHLWFELAGLQTFVESCMSMTNEQIRQQQPPPRTNRNLKSNGSIASGGGAQETITNAEPPDTAILIQPPLDPAKRQEFWLDTCRGVAHLHLACAQVQELYRKYGCRFTEPTFEQVRGILEALDGAMPKWESEHPELFYQTLELSFPELVIHR